MFNRKLRLCRSPPFIDRAFSGLFGQVEAKLRFWRKPGESLSRGAVAFRQWGIIVPCAGYSLSNAFTHRYRRLFDYQFGVAYRRQQQPNGQEIEFYGHTLVGTFGREP
jgi:hypothetical protein